VGRVATFAGRAALEAFAASHAHVLLRPLRRVAGVIFKVERVRPRQPGRFAPNRGREMTPEFLEALVVELRRRKVDIISLDDMHRRLMEPDRKARRFACVTCDGGYVDHHTAVHPIFRKHDAPFAIFIPTAFPDRIGELWWLILEAAIGNTDRMALLFDGREQRIDCRTASEKSRLFEALWSWLVARPTNEEIIRYVDDLAARYGVDVKAICADVCMNWTQIAALAADPLVTVGAQSVNHPILAKLPEAKVRFEMTMSRSVIESAVGVTPRYFAYPFGRKGEAGRREFEIAGALGFRAALTSRPGAVRARHSAHMMELPRMSLAGGLQHLRYVPMLMSGVSVSR
jgi:peptidoglycan/xylan/chitin deacetylase (PgdA/CDA1 family)